MMQASRDDVRSILDMTIELVVHVWMKHALSKQALRQIVTKKKAKMMQCARTSTTISTTARVCIFSASRQADFFLRHDKQTLSASRQAVQLRG